MRNDGVEVGQSPPRPVNVIRHGWPGALACKDFAATKLAYAPEGLRASRQEEEQRRDESIDGIDGIDGAPAVAEHALFHRPTRTLVLTDLVFNVRAPRGIAANVVLWLVGCHGRLAQSRAWRFFIEVVHEDARRSPRRSPERAPQRPIALRCCAYRDEAA